MVLPLCSKTCVPAPTAATRKQAFKGCCRCRPGPPEAAISRLEEKSMPDGMKKNLLRRKKTWRLEAESSMLPTVVQLKSDKAHCLVTSYVFGIVFPAKQAFFAVRQLFSKCGKPPQVARVLIDTAAKACFRGRGNQHTQF